MILSLILFGKDLRAQEVISGFVGQLTTGQPLIGVTISVLDQRTNSMLKYTRTDIGGEYRLILPPDSVKVILRYSALGFSHQTRILTPAERRKGVVDAVLMEVEVYRMDEVFIHSKPSYRQFGDTLSFYTEVYRTGEEQVIGDLLKRLPGFELGEDGTIRIGNQQIEKIMVEGDDFFNKAYPIITKSLPAYPIAEVQVLKNYTDKAILKGIEKSDKIALNLKLDEAYRYVWFGNVMTGLGLQRRTPYDLKSEAMNFAKHNKYFLLVDFNNTGRSSSSWADFLMEDETESLILSQISTRAEFSPEDVTVQDKRGRRTRFEQTETISLNNIVSLSPRWKVKTVSFLNRNRTNLSEMTHESISDFDIAYERHENLNHFWKNQDGIVQVELAGELGDRATFNSLTKVRRLDQDTDILGLVNTENLNESEGNAPSGLEQSFSYIKRWSEKSALVLGGQFILGKIQKSYLRENTAFKHDYRYHHQGVNLKFITRTNPSESWTFEVGALNKMDEFRFPLLSPDSLWMPNYQKVVLWKSRFQTFEWLTQTQFKKNMGRFDLQGKLKTMQNLSGYIQNKHIRFSPGISLGWSFKSDHKISLRYSYSYANHPTREFIPFYSRSDFRSAERGTLAPDLSEMSTLILNHIYNDWSKGLFIHTMGYLVYFHKTLSTRTQLNPWFSWSDRLWINDPFILNFQSGVDYYFEPISSNVKLKFLWNRSRSYFQLNSPSLKEYLNVSNQYELELRSAFSGIFNYHIGAKRRYSYSRNRQHPERDLMSHESFFDFHLKPVEDWKITAELEWYYSSQPTIVSAHQVFLNSTLHYRFKGDRFNLNIVGENLLNEKYLNHFQLNEYAFIHQRQSLVPRRIIFRLSCRI